MHKDMAEIVAAIVSRKKDVYLCTNGLLLKNRLKDYSPSSYLTLSFHIDGNRSRHDALAGREGVYDQVVEAIKLACTKGFRATVNSTLYEGVTVEETAQFLDFVMTLGVKGITISPAYGYARASQKEIFLKRTKSEQLFRNLFRLGRGRKWRFHHSGLFLDFLAGNQAYPCTPWGNPARNIFGWQRPCYLLMDEGHAPTFQALMEETDWQRYGPGRNPKCADCMLHSGFEPTAVNDALAHPFKAIRVLLRGPGAEGTKAEGWQKKDSNIPPKRR